MKICNTREKRSPTCLSPSGGGGGVSGGGGGGGVSGVSGGGGVCGVSGGGGGVVCVVRVV